MFSVKSLILLGVFFSTFSVQATTRLVIDNEKGHKVGIVYDFDEGGTNLPALLKRVEIWSPADLEKLLHEYPNVDRSPRVFRSTPVFRAELTEPIWETKANWSMEWEKKYAEWVENEVDEHFFQKYQIETDCADVAVSLRWIFSRINGLSMGFSLADTGILFTNESMREAWAKLPRDPEWSKDKLFLASLNYVMGMTFTKSLMADSYPVKISPTFFMSGVHHLDFHYDGTGHTMFVNRMGIEWGGVNLVYSNVPRIVRQLYSEQFYSSYQKTDPADGGFLKIRWVEKQDGVPVMIAAEQMPGYSMEQYDPNFMNGTNDFTKAFLQHLGLDISPEVKFKKLKITLLALLKDRIQVVEGGYSFCQINDCSEGTENYENWSTPSRDKRIQTIFETIENAAYDNSNVRNEWNKLQQEVSYIIEGQQIFLSDLRQTFLYEYYSSNPNDTIARRWGL